MFMCSSPESTKRRSKQKKRWQRIDPRLEDTEWYETNRTTTTKSSINIVENCVIGYTFSTPDDCPLHKNPLWAIVVVEKDNQAISEPLPYHRSKPTNWKFHAIKLENIDIIIFTFGSLALFSLVALCIIYKCHVCLLVPKYWMGNLYLQIPHIFEEIKIYKNVCIAWRILNGGILREKLENNLSALGWIYVFIELSWIWNIQ